MKKRIKNLRRAKAFTLLETLVVIMIIAALILLFAPKLMSQKDVAIKKSDNALVKVVHEQYQIYALEDDNGDTGEIKGKKLTSQQLNALVNKEYITQSQKKRYEKIDEKDIE